MKYSVTLCFLLCLSIWGCIDEKGQSPNPSPLANDSSLSLSSGATMRVLERGDGLKVEVGDMVYYHLKVYENGFLKYNSAEEKENGLSVVAAREIWDGKWSDPIREALVWSREGDRLMVEWKEEHNKYHDRRCILKILRLNRASKEVKTSR